MRRLLTLAAFLLILSIVPICAQRGGHAGGGFHGGFSGGHGGFTGHSSFAGHSAGIGHSGFGASHFGSRGGFSGHGFRRDNFRHERVGFGFRNRCYGCWGYGYPYYYDPFLDAWWWDNGSYSNEDYVRDREVASEMNEQNLEEQQMLREQDQNPYARRPFPPRAQPVRQEQARNDPPTVLVYRNEQHREIQNYAIADGILWNFAASKTEKIPLAIIDIPATIKANDDRGVDFRVPVPGEGQ